MSIALVIDDHPVTHLGCSHLLRDLGYQTVLEACDAAEAYRQTERHQPTLIILDLGLPGVGGLNMIEHLLTRCPKTEILIFSMNEQAVFAAKALECGARGYLSKNSSPDDFREAVATVTSGKVYLKRAMAIKLATMNTSDRSDPISNLTPREQQVLRLIGQGHELQTIAGRVNISYKTAANTSSILKKKLGVASLPELIRIAIVNEMA